MSQGYRAMPPAPPDDIEDADPGLARERTELAWTRTAISFAAIGAAIAKYRPVVGIPVMLLGAAVWPLGYLSRTRNTARSTGRRVLLVTAAVTIVAAVGLVLAVIGHPARGLLR